MLNPAVGSAVQINGASWIATTIGAAGHAIYGDYIDYPAGHYAVEFRISTIDGQDFKEDLHCAEIDVSQGNDTIILARRNILLSDLRPGPQEGPTRFILTFRLDAPGRLQFRVGVNGLVSLLIEDHRPVVLLGDHATARDANAALANARFPNPDAPDAPAFLSAHRDTLRHLFDRGIGVRVQDGDVILEADGVAFLARVPDDLTFVGEVFFERAYQIGLPADACVIDVGMNCGLVTLLMASQAKVGEVHAFEPFAETYARAQANIAINPTLAPKIVCHNVALSDHDEDGTFIVPDMGSSGAMTIRQIGDGIPMTLSIRDAATMLGPVIDAAVAVGRKVVMKVDCEGSEFAIFESLEQAGLLEKVSAFMVEWHRVYDDKSQATLLEPLQRLGFITFDRSPKTGNGFFYAVRAAD